MIDYGGHDWAAVIGAKLEAGDPPVAYVCQFCGRVLPGLIVIVSSLGGDDVWLQQWLALPEHAGAEVQRTVLPTGTAYVADPRAVDLQACLAAESMIAWAAGLGAGPPFGARLARPATGDTFRKVKIT
jgi:hypothetical protein